MVTDLGGDIVWMVEEKNLALAISLVFFGGVVLLVELPLQASCARVVVHGVGILKAVGTVSQIFSAACLVWLG